MVQSFFLVEAFASLLTAEPRFTTSGTVQKFSHKSSYSSCLKFKQCLNQTPHTM